MGRQDGRQEQVMEGKTRYLVRQSRRAARMQGTRSYTIYSKTRNLQAHEMYAKVAIGEVSPQFVAFEIACITAVIDYSPKFHALIVSGFQSEPPVYYGQQKGLQIKLYRSVCSLFQKDEGELANHVLCLWLYSVY